MWRWFGARRSAETRIRNSRHPGWISRSRTADRIPRGGGDDALEFGLVGDLAGSSQRRAGEFDCFDGVVRVAAGSLVDGFDERGERECLGVARLGDL